jgi:DNA-binding transcriptional LysR family regulator
MTVPTQTDSTPILIARVAANAGRAVVGSRVGLLALAAAALGLGLAFNWSWLVAAGIAPLIVGILPCAAMCALGPCTMGMGRKAAAPTPSSDPTQGTDAALMSHSSGCGSSQPSNSAGASTKTE